LVAFAADGRAQARDVTPTRVFDVAITDNPMLIRVTPAQEDP